MYRAVFNSVQMFHDSIRSPEDSNQNAYEDDSILADRSCSSRCVPVPGLYWADADSIGPVQAQYWQLMAFLQG